MSKKVLRDLLLRRRAQLDIILRKEAQKVVGEKLVEVVREAMRLCKKEKV